MLIAIEGIDGSGKGTQSKAIVDSLRGMGIPATVFSFPYYSETFFGKEVGRYLNGDYGNIKEVPVEFASLLYAGDRFEKKDDLLKCLKGGGVVVCDRYVPSNLAHQSAKCPEIDQARMVDWISHVEYGIYGLPEPDLIFLLDLSVEISVQHVLKKKARDYTVQKLDLHESSSSYLESVRRAYLNISNDSRWNVVSCECDGVVLSIDDITKKIMSVILNRMGL